MDELDILLTAMGIASALLAVLGNQFRNMKYVLLFQIAANVLLAVQYIVQGSFVAFMSAFIAVTQMTVSVILNMKGKRFSLSLCLAFALAYLVSSIVFYTSPWDIMTFIAMMFFCVSVIQTESFVYRAALMVNILLWLIYDIVKAPSAVFMHGSLMIFTAAAIIRLDRNDIGNWIKKIFNKKEV